MKTFKEFLLTEIARDYYHSWGVIHPSGKIISGDAHPDALTHFGLTNKIKGKTPAQHFTHFIDHKIADSRGDDNHSLILYTNHNKKSLGGALKAYDKLPHNADNRVEHEHGENVSYIKGHKAKVYNHLKQLHSDAPEN